MDRRRARVCCVVRRFQRYDVSRWRRCSNHLRCSPILHPCITGSSIKAMRRVRCSSSSLFVVAASFSMAAAFVPPRAASRVGPRYKRATRAHIRGWILSSIDAAPSCSDPAIHRSKCTHPNKQIQARRPADDGGGGPLTPVRATSQSPPPNTLLTCRRLAPLPTHPPPTDPLLTPKQRPRRTRARGQRRRRARGAWGRAPRVRRRRRGRGDVFGGGGRRRRVDGAAGRRVHDAGRGHEELQDFERCAWNGDSGKGGGWLDGDEVGVCTCLAAFLLLHAGVVDNDGRPPPQQGCGS